MPPYEPNVDAATPLPAAPIQAPAFPSPLRCVPRLACRSSNGGDGTRTVPEETPIAFVYDGTSEAVMLATPADLDDFAVGFSLTEGIITAPDEIADREIVAREAGIEIRLWLRKARRPAYRARRRRLAGPLGCGLCGIESLDQAVRSCPPVTGLDGFEADDIARAIAALGQSQTLNREAHALHAAGFFVPMRGLVGLREDVGRHNALDKLAGSLAVSGIAGATGAVVITSRVSVEMVQKTAAIGAPVLIAVSVPTALAIRHAADAGITLVAVARGAAFEIFSHRERISGLGSTP